MKLSRAWLEKYLPTDQTDQELSEILTTLGLEVEGVEQIESIKGGLKGVVTGQVLTCEKHPDADKLSITTVDIGAASPLHIVCGAPNVAVEQKVLVATVGTTIYTEDGNFQIKKSKIRGQVSEGMICAADELGLGNDHSGIMVLPDSTPTGQPAADLFDLSTDTVFDIGLTPNRSDATSQFGVAKDLYAYVKVNIDPNITLIEPHTSNFHINNTKQSIKVEVKNPQACPRYSGLLIDDIKVKESPDWLKKLLKSIGVKPINNVVDSTNYVLHELGQPLHAFDADKIVDNTIIVQTCPAKTKFKALDDREFELDEKDLMICDGEGIGMCIGGVFGGKNSGVTENTNRVFLESAYFDAGWIRRTSMRHNLRTDAAKIYEKGADPNITVFALKRAAQMICELTGGIVVSEITDIYPKSIEPAEIRLRYSQIDKIIGQPIPEDTIHQILNALGMEISPIDDDSIKVKVPTNKFDVTREIDLIEEILRIYGFNEVSIPKSLKSNISYTSHPDKLKIKDSLGNHLASLGLNEMMGLSLIESKLLNKSNTNESTFVKINNTSNITLDTLRPDMLRSGLLSVVHNLNRQQTRCSLFEFGKTYERIESGYAEKEYLSIFITGDELKNSWLQSQEAYDYYHIKALVHEVLELLNISKYQQDTIGDDERFVYGLKYFRGNQSIVHFGEVHPQNLKDIGIKQPVFYAEFEIENILNAMKNNEVNVSEISRYPAVTRDLALVVDKNVTFDEIESIARKTIKGNLSNLTLFDVFEDEEKLGKNKKSYAISFTFEDMEKTMDDKQIDNWMQNLIIQYEKKIDALIRK